MTNEERLTQTQQRLALYITAEQQILAGAQSYSIGNRTLSRADLADIQQTIKDLTLDCAKLSRPGGIATRSVIIRDR